MQSAVLAVAFSLSAMGCHHGSACGGVMHRHACYSSCYSGGCYGGGCYGGGCYGGGFGGRRMASFAGGYPQGWSSPGYAPMSYSGGGYSGYSGQMMGYSPMSSGYATPMVGNSTYGAAAPVNYGTPGTMAPGTTTYSSAYGRPVTGTFGNAGQGQMTPANAVQGMTGVNQPGAVNQSVNNVLNGAGRMATPTVPGAPPAPSVSAPPAAPAPGP